MASALRAAMATHRIGSTVVFALLVLVVLGWLFLSPLVLPPAR